MRAMVMGAVAAVTLAACAPSPATTSAAAPPRATAAAVRSTDTVPREELCATTRDVAQRVMRARQLGIPEEEVLARVQAVDHVGLQRVADSVARAAYSQPIYSGEIAQDRAVADFVRQQETRCQNRLASR